MSALTPLLLDYDNAARLLGMTRAALRDLVYVTAVRLRSSLAAGRCSPTATSRPGRRAPHACPSAFGCRPPEAKAGKAEHRRQDRPRRTVTCRTLILVPSRGFSPLTTVKAFFPAQVDCQSRHEDRTGNSPTADRRA